MISTKRRLTKRAGHRERPAHDRQRERDSGRDRCGTFARAGHPGIAQILPGNLVRARIRGRRIQHHHQVDLAALSRSWCAISNAIDAWNEYPTSTHGVVPAWRPQRRHIGHDQVFQDRRGVGVVSGRGVMPRRRPGDFGRKDRMLRRHQLRGIELVQAGADEIDRRLGRALPQLNHRGTLPQRQRRALAEMLGGAEDSGPDRGAGCVGRRRAKMFSRGVSCIFSCGFVAGSMSPNWPYASRTFSRPGYIETNDPGKFTPELWSIRRLPLTPGFQRAFVPAAQRNMINECQQRRKSRCRRWIAAPAPRTCAGY